MTRDLVHLDPLAHYSAASERAADQIIRAYSTSFGAATRLLGARHRRHIRNIYALVRVADELVDGVASVAQLPTTQQLQRLNALEAETESAMASGYSSNPIVHAFAVTARLSGIDATLTAPFFASMRMDLPVAASAGATTDLQSVAESVSPSHASTTDMQAMTESVSAGTSPDLPTAAVFDAATHADYVYGSAEVVGLMCLRVFLRDEQLSPDDRLVLDQGARSLGAAFQNVNFLRDLADDTGRLDRSYLSDGRAITEELKARWVDTICQQLADAEAVLPLLPRDARVAVDCAWRLFSRLNERLRNTPVELLLERRVRVSNPTKLLLILQSIGSTRKRRAA